jgi:hypothetical protein
MISDEKNLVSEEAPTFYDDVESRWSEFSQRDCNGELVRRLEKGCTELALRFKF